MMRLSKKIIISVFEDGSTKISEESYDLNIEETPDNIKEIVSETVTITPSFGKYNLINFSKRGELYRTIQIITDETREVIIEFEGYEFKGKLDTNTSRIYSLPELIRFASRNKTPFEPGKKLNLELNTGTKILKITMSV
jgi:hypothetical protein